MPTKIWLRRSCHSSEETLAFIATLRTSSSRRTSKNISAAPVPSLPASVPAPPPLHEDSFHEHMAADSMRRQPSDPARLRPC